MPHASRLRSARRLIPALALVVGAHGSAGAQGFGPTPATSSNCLPFGCAVAGYPGSRYQQVYAADTFAGPLQFDTIAFFTDPAFQHDLNAGSFDLYLSTTTAAVDGLSPTNFDANLGATAVLFGTFTIGGTAPPVLRFVGAAYTYDPNEGNLLLDLRVNGRFAASANVSAFLAQNGTADGSYSRATNFGDGTAGYGLETQFSSTPAVSVQTTSTPVVSTPAVARAQTVVPEPAPWALLGAGLLSVGVLHGVRAARRWTIVSALPRETSSVPR